MTNQLWDILYKANLLEGSPPTYKHIESPWFVKILLAISGWLAAFFLLGFVGFLTYHLLGSLLNETLLVLIGSILVFLAFALLHSPNKDNEFVEHLAFSFSIAGQIFLVIGIYETFNFSGDMDFWLIIGWVEIPLLLMMPNAIHRLVSTFISAISFAIYIYSYRNISDGLLLYTATLMLVTSYLWLNEFKSQKKMDTLRAIAYGLVLALITITGTKLFMYTSIWQVRIYSPENAPIQPWMGELLLSIVSLYIVQTLLSRKQVKFLSTTWILTLAATILLTFLSLEAHGLIVGVMILILGFSASNRILMGLGILSLIFYTSSYYYLLSTTLLDKSLTLLVLGILFLFSRWIMLTLLSRSDLNNNPSNGHLPTLSTKVNQTTREIIKEKNGETL